MRDEGVSGVAGHHGLGSCGLDVLTPGRGGVAAVAYDARDTSQSTGRGKEAGRCRQFMPLARSEGKGQRAALRVADRAGLGAIAAATAPERVQPRPL